MKCAVSETTTNPKWGQASDALNAELGKAIYGEQTPQQALTKAVKKGQALLGQ